MNRRPIFHIEIPIGCVLYVGLTVMAILIGLGMVVLLKALGF